MKADLSLLTLLIQQEQQKIEQFQWSIPDILKKNPNYKGEVKGMCNKPEQSVKPYLKMNQICLVNCNE